MALVSARKGDQLFTLIVLWHSSSGKRFYMMGISISNRRWPLISRELAVLYIFRPFTRNVCLDSSIHVNWKFFWNFIFKVITHNPTGQVFSGSGIRFATDQKIAGEKQCSRLGRVRGLQIFCLKEKSGKIEISSALTRSIKFQPLIQSNYIPV